MRPRLLITALAAAVLALPASAGAYTFVTKWGSTGTAPGQFDKVANIALDPLGNVYAADENNHRIQKFTADGTFIAKFGDTAGPGLLSSPYGLAASRDGSLVYVSDSDKVFEYTAAGAFVRSWGGTGAGTGQFDDAAGIAVGTTGNVYVADFNNNRVQEFTPAGTFVRAWGSAGSADGQFGGPDGLASDAAGNVYVTEDSGQRVQQFTPDGTFIRKWGSAGTGDGLFDGPFAAAVDPSGYVWVADAANHRVQQFRADGTFVGKFGSTGPGDGQITTPNGLAANCRGIYVADIDADRIQLFSDPSICPAPPVPPVLPDKTAPVLKLSASRTQRVLKERGIRLKLSANEDATFTASASVALPRGAAKTLRFKRSKATLKAGARKTVKLGLAKRTLTQLRNALKPRRRTLKAKVTITAQDAAGNSSTKRLAIKLKR